MTLAALLLGLASIPVLAPAAYLGAASLLSARRAPAAASAGSRRPRFAVVVPAHDEARGIAATIESLFAVDYPRDRYRVVVVADNCSDDTAAVAAASGASVLVRSDPERRGKGHALAFAFERLAGDCDAIVVVDADSVVSTNLLGAFAAKLEGGAGVLQARYGVRNPSASWRTRLMAIALAAFHDVRSLARERLGLSCGLRGNGMCFSAEVLREVRYAAFSIVEDVELGLRLGEAGHAVRYVDEARVDGEMAADASAATTQRRRWESGRAAIARDQALGILARGLRRGDPVLVDLAIDLLIPPLGTLLVSTAAGLLASGALALRTGHLPAAAWPWIVCAAAFSAYGARGWQLSATGVEGLASLFHVPGYIAWKLAARVARASHAPGDWVRTARKGESA